MSLVPNGSKYKTASVAAACSLPREKGALWTRKDGYGFIAAEMLTTFAEAVFFGFVGIGISSSTARICGYFGLSFIWTR